MSNFVVNPYVFAGGDSAFESNSYQNDNDNTGGQSMINFRVGMGIRVVAGSSLIGKVVDTVEQKFYITGTMPSVTTSGRLYSGSNVGTGTHKATSDNSVNMSGVSSLDTVTWDFAGTSTANKTLAENWAIIMYMNDTTGSDYPSPYTTDRYKSGDTTDDGEFVNVDLNEDTAFETQSTSYNNWIKVTFL